MLAPIYLLTILIASLAVAIILIRVHQRQLRRSLRRFAITHRYHYAEIDRFDLAHRTPLSHLTLGPIVEAHARHVLYRRSGSLRELIFVIDLLIGGSSPKRDRLVIRADEPCDDPSACNDRNDSTGNTDPNGNPPHSAPTDHANPSSSHANASSSHANASSVPALTVRSHARVERNILSSLSRLLS